MPARAKKRCKVNSQLRFDRQSVPKPNPLPTMSNQLTPAQNIAQSRSKPCQPTGTPETSPSHPFVLRNTLTSSCYRSCGITRNSHMQKSLIQQPRENTTAVVEYFITRLNSTNRIPDPQMRNTPFIIK